MSDIKARIRAATLAERTVPICLAGDLVADFEAAERDLLEASRRPESDSLESSPLREAAERVEQLRARMAEHQVVFHLRARTRPQWRQLLDEHQPRRGDDGQIDERDRGVGVNTETFYQALIRASTVEPVLDDDDWQVLLEEKLSDAQYDALWKAAWAINRQDVDVPFSRAASRILSRSDGE